METRPVVAVDWETAELQPDGSYVASTEAYRPNFRVTSAAWTWEEDGKLKSKYLEGEDQIRAEIQFWIDRNARFLCFNVSFEGLVSRCRFPDLNIVWEIDAMRLCQVMDNGGSGDDFVLVEEEDILTPGDKPKVKRSPTEGLGLVKCVQRILGDTTDHKKEAHDWIKKTVPSVKPKSVGSYLHLLPPEIMKSYNVADTEQTFRLYKYITEYFRFAHYDWTFDHKLYMLSANKIISGKIRGIRVDREQLASYIEDVKKEIKAIEAEFCVRFASEIAIVEARRLDEYIAGVKSDKGKTKRREKYLAGEATAIKAVRFNPGSNAQLTTLFVDILKITPKFLTEKGAPSFKSAMLSQWGDGGRILKARRKRGIVLKHAEALYKLSEITGRFHPSLRAAGTKTGRYVGSN
jgi:hypothetical protein